MNERAVSAAIFAIDLQSWIAGRRISVRTSTTIALVAAGVASSLHLSPSRAHYQRTRHALLGLAERGKVRLLRGGIVEIPPKPSRKSNA